MVEPGVIHVTTHSPIKCFINEEAVTCINISWYLYKFHAMICDQILENISKSHMKSSTFQQVCISMYFYLCYAFPEYLLHNFNDLSIKFYIWNVMKQYRKCNTVHVIVINILN